MSGHIVSWSDSGIRISPVMSSAARIVSFDSTFSDTYPDNSQVPPSASKASGLPGAGLGAIHANTVGRSEEGKTLRSGYTTSDDSFIRHDSYFFDDGNVTFLVRGLLCMYTQRTDQPAGWWYAVLRSSVLLFSRFGLLLHTVCPT